MKKFSAVLAALVAVALYTQTSMQGQGNQSPVPGADWRTVTLSNFASGMNTVNFVGNLPPSAATDIKNLVIINGQPTFRPGYANYATISANRGIRGIFGFNRSLDNKRLTFAADSGFLWADTATGSFYAISGSGTIDSTKDVQAVTWKDTLLYVDGVQDPKKTDGKGTFDATIVTTGKVDVMSPVGEFVRDTTFEPPVEGDAFIRRKSPYADTNYGYKQAFIIGTYNGDTVRYLLKLDLSNFQAADSIAYLKLTLRAISSAFSLSDSIFCYRVTSSWAEDAVTWNTKPTFNATPIAKGRPGFEGCTLRVENTCDSMIKGAYVNYGFMFTTKESAGDPTRSYVNSREAVPSGRPSVKTSIIWDNPTTKGHPRFIIDSSNFAGQFPDNDLAGFFLYSDQDSLWRQIVGNRFDTIEIYPPIIDAKWEKNGHVGTWSVYAKPSSKDSLFGGTVDSVTVENSGDSLWRVWVGTQAGISANQFRHGFHFFKIKKGIGQGNYMILDNGESGGKDYFLVFMANKFVIGTGVNWEIFRVTFPPCADVFVGGDRVFYMQADKPYVWFSEAKNTAQVEPDNFYILGGEKLTALFGLAPTALTGFSEPLNLLFAGSNSSIWGINVNTPDVAIPQRVSAGVGISFKNSIVYLPEGGVDWLNPKGLAYRFNGRDVQKLSLTIPDRFDAISTMLAGNIAGFHYEGIDYWWEANTNYSTGLGYALSVANNAWSTHDVPFRTAFRQFVPSDSIPVLIGAVNTGKILRFGRATSDSGQVISSSYSTGWIDFGDPKIVKELWRVGFSFKGIGALPTIAPDLLVYKVQAPDGTVTLADSIEFNGTLVGYLDRVIEKDFKPGILGNYFQFVLKGIGQIKPGSLTITLRDTGIN